MGKKKWTKHAAKKSARQMEALSGEKYFVLSKDGRYFACDVGNTRRVLALTDARVVA